MNISAMDNAALDRLAVASDRRAQYAGFPYQRFDEIRNDVAKRHIIKGIFARGETSAWIAPPGGMKSALMASAAIAVASGADWFGKRNKERCAVVYFALERADLVKRRIEAHTIRKKLHGLPIVLVSETINLMKPQTVPRVVATLKAVEEDYGLPVGLVIFDTFAKLIAAGGGDEDKAKDQGAVFANVQRVKNQTDVHVALVGHTGKDETRGSRGSNAILGDVDLMVTITGDSIRTATVTKANDSPEGPLFSFKSEVHDFGTDEDGDPISVNIASDEEIDTQPARARDRWPKGLRLVHECITSALIDSGIEHRIAGNGPAVKAVDVQAARTVHLHRYVSAGVGDKDAAERKAWSSNFKKARSEGLICGETSSGRELIWLAKCLSCAPRAAASTIARTMRRLSGHFTFWNALIRRSVWASRS